MASGWEGEDILGSMAPGRSGPLNAECPVRDGAFEVRRRHADTSRSKGDGSRAARGPSRPAQAPGAVRAAGLAPRWPRSLRPGSSSERNLRERRAGVQGRRGGLAALCGVLPAAEDQDVLLA